LALNDYLRSGLNTAEQLLIPYGLARYGGSAEEAMSAYGTIHAMVFPVLMFPAAVLYALADLLVPELSRGKAMGRRLRIIDLTDKCLRLTFLFAIGVAGFLFVSADILGQWLYQSTDASHYLRIFAPMVLMLYLDAIVDGMLKGLAEQVSCVRYNTLTNAMDVVLLYVLLPRYGIQGYIFTFLLTHAVNLWLSLRKLMAVSLCRPKAKELIPCFLCLPLSVLLSHGLPEGFLRGLGFLLFLLSSATVTEALLPQDRRWLKSLIHRAR
jgi:stage V sporulation protein B